MNIVIIILMLAICGCASMSAPAPASEGCQDKSTDAPTAKEFNFHAAMQNADGTISYFVQNRSFIHCMMVTNSSEDMTKEKWEATIKDYQYVKLEG